MSKSKYSLIRNFFSFFLLPLAIILSVFSCKDKSDTLAINYQYDYAPVDSGHYVIYDVDSIVYGTSRDTASYQLMEIVTDTFYDNLNEQAYRLERFRRADENSPWGIDRVWYTKRTATNFQKVEDDIKFVKLVFPPAQDEEWNGNLFVPTVEPFKIYRNWNYQYTEVNAPYTIGSLSFDSTLTVLEVDDENLIEKTLRKEVYAKGVGLIYQEWESLTKEVTTDWITGPKSGFRIRMKVREHN